MSLERPKHSITLWSVELCLVPVGERVQTQAEAGFTHLKQLIVLFYSRAGIGKIFETSLEFLLISIALAIHGQVALVFVEHVVLRAFTLPFELELTMHECVATHVSIVLRQQEAGDDDEQAAHTPRNAQLHPIGHCIRLVSYILPSMASQVKSSGAFVMLLLHTRRTHHARTHLEIAMA